MIKQIVDLLKKRFPKYKHRDRYYEQVAQEILDSLKHECEWTESTIKGLWNTGCGKQIRYMYTDSKFCTYCGGEIKEKA